MIDIFNELYTLFDTALTTFSSKIETDSVYVNMPSHFPFVSLEETDNSVYTPSSNCRVENHANIEYEVNVYTQGTKRKSEADSIVHVVDTFFASLGFVRTSKNPIPNNDGITYRVVLRYEGIVSKDHVIFRR